MKKILILIGLTFSILSFSQKEIKRLGIEKMHRTGKTISTKIIIVDGKKMRQIKYYVHRNGEVFIITRIQKIKIKHIKI